MTKYAQYYQQMSEENAAAFAEFQKIHDGYLVDRKRWSTQFHDQGAAIVEIMRDWERRLCAGMERGNNAVYSARLSEKFWGEIKKRFPHIERVGVRSNLD